MKKDHISRMYPGFTISICFGKYGGFYRRFGEGYIGLCLGYMAITLYFFDQEVAVSEKLGLRKSDKNDGAV